jgi:putative hemolysin
MNPTKVLPAILLLLMVMVAAACGPTETPAPAAPQAALPNPASEFCEANGGRLEIRIAADGSQTGVCMFADGSECEEWAYFRAECAPGNAPGETEIPDPDSMTAAAPIALQVLLPEDGSQIDIEQCQVIGITAPGAVVTVNDEMAIAGADGSFQATIALEAGPNLIEVLASDASGAEAFIQLTVTYGP